MAWLSLNGTICIRDHTGNAVCVWVAVVGMEESGRKHNMVWKRTHTYVPANAPPVFFVFRQTYNAVVSLFAAHTMLAEAEVFVGSFSSSMDRYTMLLREIKKHARETTASVESPRWPPGGA